MEKVSSRNWSEWKKFPNPDKEGILTAPFGKGVYQLKNIKTSKFVLFGSGKNCAFRMSSLLPKPYGAGTRKKHDKRDYVLKHITNIEYRTCTFLDYDEMKSFEKSLKSQKIHLFNT